MFAIYLQNEASQKSKWKCILMFKYLVMHKSTKIQMLSWGKTWKPFKCDRVQFFRLQILAEISHSLGLQKFNTNQVQLHEMVIWTGDNQKMSECITNYVCELSENQSWKVVLSSNCQAWQFFTTISIRNSMCCCILVWGHYYSRNGKNNMLHLIKEYFWKLWYIKITKTFNIPYLFLSKGDNLQIC